MNTDRVIQVVTDAVVDALRERLPELIATHAREAVAPLAARLAEAEARVEALDVSRATVEDVEAARIDLKALGTRLERLQASLQGDLSGQVARQVAEAVRHLDLPAGPAGAPGAPGRDGRDATFVAPVHWKAGERHARGSVVAHRGGLWYAQADTSAEPGEPLSGFTLIVDGCEPVSCEADEAGALALAFRYASGIVKHVPLGFRPLAYAGVYENARTYLANDLVTCDGSMWLARREATNIRPGTDAGALVWTLVVKRGKDGRDGERGPPGERGEAGPPAPSRKKTNGATHERA